MTSNKTQPQQLVTDTWHLLSGHRGRNKLEDWSYLKGKFSVISLTRIRRLWFTIEVHIEMGKTGIPWVPWDSYGNGSKISHGMGMGWEWELCAREWELRRGSGKNAAYCN